MSRSISTPPGWFVAALAAGRADHRTSIEGVSLAYRRWGAGKCLDAVLVHGGGAHAGWWDHLAPLLVRDGRVVALDLSGHGSSGRRPDYGIDVWAGEVTAVIEGAGQSRPTVVIGHSMGGLVALRVLATRPELCLGVIVIDSALRDISPEESETRTRYAESARPYPTRAEALARFRPIPPQAHVLTYVRDHIAEGSVAASDAGWTWSVDPHVFRWSIALRDLHGSASAVPLLLLRAEHGLMDPAAARRFAADHPGPVSTVTLADSGHHAMLDHPLALLAALRVAMDAWRAFPLWRPAPETN